MIVKVSSYQFIGKWLLVHRGLPDTWGWTVMLQRGQKRSSTLSIWDGVFPVRQSQTLVALSLCLSLCPSLTCRLSDVAVILSHPFICLSNGNPPLVSLHTAALIPVLYSPSASHFSVHPSSPWVHFKYAINGYVNKFCIITTKVLH